VTVQEIIQALSLEVLAAGSKCLGRHVTRGYASDMLSCVMAGAQAGSIWVTMQGHPNVVAVASLLDVAAVVVTEHAPVDPATVQRALEHEIALLTTPRDTFTTVAQLASFGIQGCR
jgi:predicted transcriptional regulator